MSVRMVIPSNCIILMIERIVSTIIAIDTNRVMTPTIIIAAKAPSTIIDTASVVAGEKPIIEKFLPRWVSISLLFWRISLPMCLLPAAILRHLCRR